MIWHIGIVPSQTAQSSGQDSSWEHFRTAFWCFKPFFSSFEVSLCFSSWLAHVATDDQYIRFPDVSQFVFVKKLLITLLNSVAIECCQVGGQNETDQRLSPAPLLYSHLVDANVLSDSLLHNMCTCYAGFILDEVTQQSSFLTGYSFYGRWSFLDNPTQS